MKGNKYADFNEDTRNRQKVKHMDIADELKRTRAKLGLSQSQAARVWGLNVRTLQNWEQGSRSPKGLALAQLQTILANAIGEPASGSGRPATSRPCE